MVFFRSCMCKYTRLLVWVGEDDQRMKIYPVDYHTITYLW